MTVTRIGDGGRNIDNEYFFFDLAMGDKPARIIGKAKMVANAAMRVAFSADGNRVGYVREPDQVDVRDTVTGKLIGTASLEGKFSRNTFSSGLALSSDGSMLAVCDGNAHVYLYNTKDAKASRDFVVRGGQEGGAFSTQGGLAFSPDSKMLLVAVGNDVQLYDFATLKESVSWDGHRAAVDSVAFSKDSQRLYSSSGQVNMHPEEIVTWNAATWQQLQLSSMRAPKWPNVGALSPEQTFYVGKDGDDRFSLFDLATGKMLGRFNMPKKQEPRTVSFFSPGSKFYVIAGSDNAGRGMTRLFAVPSCKLVCQFQAMALSNDFQVLGNRLVGESSIAIAFSGDDRLVAVIGQDDGLIHVFDTATGKLASAWG